MDRRGRRSLRFLEKFEHLRAIFLFYKHIAKSKFKVQNLAIGVCKNEFRLSSIDVCPRGLPRKSKFEVRAIFIYHVLDKGIFCDIIITSGSPEM